MNVVPSIAPAPPMATEGTIDPCEPNIFAGFLSLVADNAPHQPSAAQDEVATITPTVPRVQHDPVVKTRLSRNLRSERAPAAPKALEPEMADIFALIHIAANPQLETKSGAAANRPDPSAAAGPQEQALLSAGNANEHLAAAQLDRAAVSMVEARSTAPAPFAQMAEDSGASESTDYFTDYVEVTDPIAIGGKVAVNALPIVKGGKVADRPAGILAEATEHALGVLTQAEPTTGSAQQPTPLLVRASESAATNKAAPATHRQASIVQDVAVEVVRSAKAGKREVSVRLDPPELGKVEVRWSVDEAGKVRTVVAADNPATLELLRRDSGQLARALNSAGVAADAGAFSFNLRQDSGNGGGQQRQAAFYQGAMGDEPSFSGTAAAPSPFSPPRRLSASSRLDLVI